MYNKIACNAGHVDCDVYNTSVNGVMPYFRYMSVNKMQELLRSVWEEGNYVYISCEGPPRFTKLI